MASNIYYMLERIKHSVQIIGIIGVCFGVLSMRSVYPKDAFFMASMYVAKGKD